ncbi:histidinol-phosphate transaminase [Buchnera aphidicola]|uniref:histidinol-phosphate transaminase n=1 Tax=Buchnera aphidicola TaxID=9 RepID=UPI0031B879EE
MKNCLKKLFRSDLLTLEPYRSARLIGGNGKIWLNANECFSPPSFNLNNFFFNRYPECQPKILLEKYSFYSGIKQKNILVSRGADEAIELLIRAFCIPGKDCIMTFPPTYMMYSKISEIYGIQNIKIPLINNIKLDFEKISLYVQNVKLIYLCRPNNPTGHLLNLKNVISVLDVVKNDSIVVIDEAYIEFCEKNTLTFLLKKYDNLIILRTLSKSFGLAGIRCGFTLAHEDIIQILNKIIAPYPLTMPSIDIAIQALEDTNILVMKNRVSVCNQNKLWLLKKIKKLSLVNYIFDSQANYILVNFFYAKKIFNILWNQGIILRDQSHELSLKNCLRITIGTKKECELLYFALKNISLEQCK